MSDSFASQQPMDPFHLPRAIKSLAGTCALAASIISFTCILLHLKNYRRPHTQRLIVRILLLLPLYALSSWLGLVSGPIASAFSSVLDPIEEAYEALVIYTFFSLLTNMLGGERRIVSITLGRSPKPHPWPFKHLLNPVDISDPYTFLYIKRGVLQYVWIKPVLSVAILIMRLTGTYQENYLGLRSGYMWIGIIYNISISMSLYSLALFWYCLFQDLQPFDPFPKFLCVKVIIFFSYWQGVLLSILVWLGIIHDVGYYTPNNIATAIQHALMCTEMLGFAIGHWYAFSYKDFTGPAYAHCARMRLPAAARDAFGTIDLMLDFKATFSGDKYTYRQFDSIETVLEHPDSRSRNARLAHGLRYQAGGKSKYWLPDPAAPQVPIIVASTGGPLHIPPPFLPGHARTGSSDTATTVVAGTTSPTSSLFSSSPLLSPGQATQLSYGTTSNQESSTITATISGSTPAPDSLLEQPFLSQQEFDADNALYAQARTLPYGDYNYPVITDPTPLVYRPFLNTHTSTRDPYIRSQLEQEYLDFGADSPRQPLL
ncbi:uncharacterized protein SAPINGB_P005230 [Magnusiomyces paraingens]|uniref:Uncharacterized protein n=1 Tax=Magnusiomyces paraingens TaxID=2606893 RepID=A0A5E8C667_9ASCO|nr:uncharacterized protein SAPINGB_P005230 [Saprochaete ingens]VVT56716.1 unnamed protein product [Saprochaete ingens]